MAYSAIQIIWLSEEVPANWRKQLTIPLHRKGTYEGCNKFRSIALLSIPGKVFCRVLQNRLKEIDNKMLWEDQCGFGKRKAVLISYFHYAC